MDPGVQVLGLMPLQRLGACGSSELTSESDALWWSQSLLSRAHGALLQGACYGAFRVGSVG
jgi:hypothetical protein